MANQLKMAKVQSIQTLHARGWSQRRIARELGVHRETVARYVRIAEAGPRAGPDSLIWQNQNQPNPPTGSLDQNQPILSAGASGPLSLCEPFREIILAALERGLSCQRIWQDLKNEHGFGGGYDSVKRFCRRLTQATPLPFRRLECEPGAEAQVDFGTAAPVVTPAVTSKCGGTSLNSKFCPRACFVNKHIANRQAVAEIEPAVVTNRVIVIKSLQAIFFIYEICIYHNTRTAYPIQTCIVFLAMSR